MKSTGYSLFSAQPAIAAKITAGLSRTRPPPFCELGLHACPGNFFAAAFEFGPFVLTERPSRLLAVVACLFQDLLLFSWAVRECRAKAAAGEHGHGDEGFGCVESVSYTHLRAHETDSYLVC